uniref:Uncharacterized protein n=1 Tax=Chromera velia CCMP2878 TaxID=1169474 RepID=A0A0G4IDI6_9ALVE|eukprot:Cvel_2346.t1-p1 / transcript=Cvel_2346.t1 / gene=Cvel_2346 / organism=Chromera_velia_CCMP2878 / gene_product=hypothetical protein / transcript_product=hypothetical protein / location=Cvel_scaffold91:7642-8929(-) / protein_length=182 / sequence_SO=supercontig / SO=protein_coding / is_pseudo=false
MRKTDSEGAHAPASAASSGVAEPVGESSHSADPSPEVLFSGQNDVRRLSALINEMRKLGENLSVHGSTPIALKARGQVWGVDSKVLQAFLNLVECKVTVDSSTCPPPDIRSTLQMKARIPRPSRLSLSLSLTDRGEGGRYSPVVNWDWSLLYLHFKSLQVSTRGVWPDTLLAARVVMIKERN